MFPFEDEDDELAQDDYGLPLRPGEFQLQDGTAPGDSAGISPCQTLSPCCVKSSHTCPQSQMTSPVTRQHTAAFLDAAYQSSLQGFEIAV